MSWRRRIAQWLMKSGGGNWFAQLLGDGSPGSKIVVTAETAQRSAAVFACVQCRSQDIAKLPLPLYRRLDDDDRERAVKHELWRLIRQPRPALNSFNWREMQQAFCDLRGNAYSRIMHDRRERATELIPLHTSWVNPLVTPDGKPYYDVRMYGKGPIVRLAAEEMLHLKDRSDDGYVGRSVISRARDVFEADLAKTRHGAKLYSNGARPAALLIPKGGTIAKEGRDLAQQEFEQRFGGENLYSVGVMGQEMDYKQLGMTSVDADFINDRKLGRAEIGSLFRVPPHKIGIMDNATFSNIEHQSLEYVTDTLMPIARRWEEELNNKLLREAEKEEFYFEFNFEGLLRGDFLSRMQGYAIQRQWGLASYNTIAQRENWRRLSEDKGGDERLVPLNMWPMGQPRPEKTLGEQPAPSQPGKAYEDYGGKVLQIPVQK
jgi:HK97 family phage portal protein